MDANVEEKDGTCYQTENQLNSCIDPTSPGFKSRDLSEVLRTH